MNSNSMAVDGIPMRWLEAGEAGSGVGVGVGVAVILVHGIPTSPLLWRHVVPRLRNAQCFAWEMVGYGDSIPAGQDRDISVAKQADYLLRWMEEMELPSAILAGHDLGGGVVQIAAVRRPSACRGLFLTNSIGYDAWPVPTAKLLRRTGALVRLVPDGLFRQAYRAFLHRAHDDAGRAEEALGCHWPFYARHGGAAAMVRQARSLDVRDTLAIAEDLPKLDIPARVAWGTGDPFLKLRYGERFARDLKAPLARIDGGKHFTPEDHPDVIAREINALVNQVRV